MNEIKENPPKTFKDIKLINESGNKYRNLKKVKDLVVEINKPIKTGKTKENYKILDYCFDGLNINGDKYYLEFEVCFLDSSENQYKLQRIDLKKEAPTSKNLEECFFR